MKRTALLLLAIAAAAPALAQTTYSAETALNLTVQPAGPRQGANGLRFFNIEGELVGSQAFRSWGLAQFTTSSFNINPLLGAVTDVSSITLRLQSSNAAFSIPGNIRFWISRDQTTTIAQSNTALIYDGAALPDAVGSQLDPKIQVGDNLFFPYLGNANPANNGVTFTIPLTGIDATTKQFLINELNDPAGYFLVLVTPAEPTDVTATFSGRDATTQIGSPAVDPFGPTIDLSVRQAPTVTLSGTVFYGGRQSNFPTSVSIDFRQPGTLALVHTATNVTLSPTATPGQFSFSLSGANLPATPGVYDVRLKQSTWLGDSVGARDTNASQTNLDFVLVNGDIDGDNDVDIDDYDQLANAYGSFAGGPAYSAAADLDGDGDVDIDDYDLLAGAYGQFGD